MERQGQLSEQLAGGNRSPKSENLLRRDARVLILGAGGLGSECSRLLLQAGLVHLHIIDMDTVSLSNLNRQFMYRPLDIGKSKAKVLAARLRRRFPGTEITAHVSRIEQKPKEFYAQFDAIVSGLDSIEARRWINSMLVSLINEDDSNTSIPLIDGGTEGWKGHVRVIQPGIDACFECTMDLFPAIQPTYPLCTIITAPRLPEHCVEWAILVQFPNICPNQDLDPDNQEHLCLIYEHALRRATECNIEPPTPEFTTGVLRNIIPAIAATNAVIAARCAEQVLKFFAKQTPVLDNYEMVNFEKGYYSMKTRLERLDNCIVCGDVRVKVDTLETQNSPSPQMLDEKYLIKRSRSR